MNDFIAAHPLGTLVTGSPRHGLFATHLPLLLDASRGTHGVLHGHIARANPHHMCAADTNAALVIFAGINADVTPSWYAAKAEHGKVVPTWNYEAVHVTGSITFVEDHECLMRHLDLLTDTHEAERAHPWAMSDAPAAYIEQLARAVIAVAIAIESLEGK